MRPGENERRIHPYAVFDAPAGLHPLKRAGNVRIVPGRPEAKRLDRLVCRNVAVDALPPVVGGAKATAYGGSVAAVGRAARPVSARGIGPLPVLEA